MTSWEIGAAVVLVVAVVAVNLGVVRHILRDRRRVDAAVRHFDEATARLAAARTSGTPDIVAAAMPNAPDAFTAARNAARVVAACKNPHILSGVMPDVSAPRFLWWTSDAESAACDASIFPPWLGAILHRRATVTVHGAMFLAPSEFSGMFANVDTMMNVTGRLNAGKAEKEGYAAIVITAGEFAPVFASPGCVTDLHGNPVAGPVAF